MIVVLTGGSGGAKFVDGLRQVISPQDITLVINTADDFEWWGLHISPDIDSITYVLANLLSKERGWGVQDDTFLCRETMERLGEPAWFQVGDRDLALHLLRAKLLRQGRTLAEATAQIASRLGIRETLLPMTNGSVETRITTPAEEISFQEYFVHRRYRDEVNSVCFAGAENAQPAPDVLHAIHSAEAILLAPSNPVTSIGPILAIPGIREALRQTSATVAAISPVVGGAAVSGPAGTLMRSQRLPVSPAGIAQAYEDFLDILIADVRDQQAAERMNPPLRVHYTNTIMKTHKERAELARSVLGSVSLPAR
jgi:LPPG:FO 2-phospho-L-lactate transferase